LTGGLNLQKVRFSPEPPLSAIGIPFVQGSELDLVIDIICLILAANPSQAPNPAITDAASAAAAAAAAAYARMNVYPAPSAAQALQGTAPPAPPETRGMQASGGSSKAKPEAAQYETVEDKCCSCKLFRKELHYFSCGHYPFCSRCMKDFSRRTPGALNCPVRSCNEQVTEVRQVFRIRKVKKD